MSRGLFDIVTGVCPVCGRDYPVLKSTGLMRYHTDYRTKTRGRSAALTCAGVDKPPASLNLTVKQDFVMRWAGEVRELVCCDVYDRAHAISWGSDFSREILGHESCYWVELAVRAAEERAGVRGPCDCPRCSRLPRVKEAQFPLVPEPKPELAPERRPMVLDDAEWKKAAHASMTALDVTYMELAAMARNNYFDSDAHKRLWTIIAGTL